MNRTLQTLHKALHNRHAQACAHNLRHTEAAVAFKRVKNFLEELLRHTAAGILHDERILRTATAIAQLLAHKEAYASLRLRILHSVRKNIIQYLLQALQITAHQLVFIKQKLLLKIFLLQLGLRREHIADIARHLRQRERFLHMLHLGVVKACHIQNIVNQGQQLLAGGTDFLDIIAHHAAVILVQLCQLSHADNAVQRCTHIMRHRREEHVA